MYSFSTCVYFVFCVWCMLCHTSPGWSLVEATGQSDDNFNSCSAVTRCSECVYDPADGLMPPALSCGWCASTGTCTEVNRSILSLYLLSDEMLNTSARKKRDNFCPDLRHRKHNPSCPDMSCSAAYRTNNIYFCRASSIVALVFACLLLPLNVAALLWARTITQLPWVYEPYLRTLVRNEKEHKNSDKDKYEAVLKEVKDKIDNEVHLRQNPRLATNSNNNSNNSNNSAPKLLRGKCPICGRVKPSLLGPGEVCVWCNAARLCFLPLTIGLLVMSLILIFSFVLSLKPWFSDVYFYVLLAFAYGAYLAAYVYLRHQSRVLIQPFRQSAGLDPQLAAENEVLLLLQSTLYVHLTVWLRGRNLLKVFPMLEPLRHRERAPTGAAAAHPNAGPAKAEHLVPKAPKPKKKPHVRFEEEMTTREEGKETEVVVEVDDEFPLPTAIPSDMNTPHFSRSTNSESMFSTSGYSPELSQLQHTVQSNTNHNNHNNGPSSQTHGMNSRVNIIEKVVDPIPPTLRKQKKTETLHLLSTDILSAQNRKILKETLFRDEIVLWCYRPLFSKIMRDSDWLLTNLTVGLFFGVWIGILASINDERFAIVKLTRSTSLGLMAMAIIAFFSVMLAMLFRGCRRLYLLTDQRLITVYEGIAKPIITFTDLKSVKYACIHGYNANSFGLFKFLRGLLMMSKGQFMRLVRQCRRKEETAVIENNPEASVAVAERKEEDTETSLVRQYYYKHRNPILIFSWEVPASERKLPPIRSHNFTAISDTKDFLHYFNMVVPPLPMRLEQTSATLSQQRKLSRAVVCVVLVFLLTLPVYTFPYPKAVPSFLSLFLFLLVLALLVCSINSSLRTLQCTSAPLAQAEVWAKVEEDQLRLELEEDLSEEDEGGQAPPERKERDQDGDPADHEEPQEGSAAEPGEEGRVSLSPSSSDEGEHVKGSKHLQLPTGNYNPHHLRSLNNNDSMIDNSSFNHIDRTSLENMVNSPKRPLNNNENEV